MISVRKKNVFAAIKRAYIDLYRKKGGTNDPKLLKEDEGIIVVTGNRKCLPYLSLIKGEFICGLNYSDYFPYANKNLIHNELDYWRKKIIKSNKLNHVISHIRNYPNTKRAILNFLEHSIPQIRGEFPCVSYIYFRKRGEFVDVHAHMRATNANFMMLMDATFVMGIQKIVADELGLKCGIYIQYMDSLHFYKKEASQIDRQLKFMAKSKIWKNL